MKRPFGSAAVERTFAAYPPAMRRKLLALRALIFKTAAATDGVGDLDETLRWGEPAYDGNRAIVFDPEAKVPVDALSLCIESALTYPRKKSKES